MKRGLFSTVIFLIPLLLCAQTERAHVAIETDSGTITLALYNETPIHRDNFLKLVGEGFYDGTAFHRIIEDFMIQGGDPNSKEGVDGAAGNGGPGYTIPAEINDSLFHKKGALCAARKGDNINPNRESSGSQFYIVQGRTFDDEQIIQFEQRINGAIRNKLMQAFFSNEQNLDYFNRLKQAKKDGNQEEIQNILEEVNPIIDAEMEGQTFTYTDEQKAIYTTLGGTPHLDMQYTVFGEVVDGLEVVDKIASVEKKGETPVKPIRMTIKVIE